MCHLRMSSFWLWRQTKNSCNGTSEHPLQSLSLPLSVFFFFCWPVVISNKLVQSERFVWSGQNHYTWWRDWWAVRCLSLLSHPIPVLSLSLSLLILSLSQSLSLSIPALTDVHANRFSYREGHDHWPDEPVFNGWKQRCRHFGDFLLWY